MNLIFNQFVQKHILIQEHKISDLVDLEQHTSMPLLLCLPYISMAEIQFNSRLFV